METPTRLEVITNRMMDWRKLTSISEFNHILMQSLSEGSAFVLFKHSTRCIVSKMALRSFESEYKSDMPAYFIDLIQNRELSNYIAETSGVHHQSPQVITFKNGKVTYSESHYSICAVSAVK